VILPSPLRALASRLIADYWVGDPIRRQEIAHLLDRTSGRGLARELLAQLQFRLGLEKAWVTPRAVRFEVTNRCNLKCVMCPQPETMHRPKVDLDLALFRRFLEANPRVEEVDLFNWGEPLLHPRILDFVSEASSRGLYTRLVTNAVLLDERRAEGLIRAGLREILFSFDGVGEDFERIRGIPIGRPLANVKRFLEARRRLCARVRTGINITQSPWNRGRVEAAAAELTALGVDAVIIQPSEDYSAEYRRRAPCFEPYRYAVVLSDARVVPCCVDFDGELEFGSLAEEVDLRRLYNAPRIRSLRRSLRSPETMARLCSRCTFKIPAAERPSEARARAAG
jgi:radical SAM family protein/iron-sulfur cluster protein